MKKLEVIIVHKLPHRVRIRLSSPIKNLESFKYNVAKDSSDIQIEYSPITKSVVATFDIEVISLQEVIYKLITAFSIENGLMPVKVSDGIHTKAIENFALYSGASIAMAGLNMLINRNDLKLQNMMNWFSLGLTSVAILEHGYKEVTKKGAFDLEILPAVYLIKSFLNTPKLSIVAMIWLTTFGRHLLVSNNRAKEVKVLRIKNQKEDRFCYIANVSDYRKLETVGDVLEQVFFKKHNSSIKQSEKYITISN